MTFDIDSAAQAQVDARARRERIATKCLQGLLASEDEDMSFCSPEGAARAAVEYADALIAELDKE
jgi:hypothetical protein